MCNYEGKAIEMPAIFKGELKLYQCNNREECKKRSEEVEKLREEQELQARKEAEEAFFAEFGTDIKERLIPLSRIRDAREHYYDPKSDKILSCRIGRRMDQLYLNTETMIRSFYGKEIQALLEKNNL